MPKNNKLSQKLRTAYKKKYNLDKYLRTRTLKHIKEKELQLSQLEERKESAPKVRRRNKVTGEWEIIK